MHEIRTGNDMLDIGIGVAIIAAGAVVALGVVPTGLGRWPRLAIFIAAFYIGMTVTGLYWDIDVAWAKANGNYADIMGVF